MKLNIWLFLVILILGLGVSACGAIANPALDEQQLEQKVLEVIRKNPQVILESVQKFQQQQQNQQSNLRSQVLSQIKAKPNLIVRDSPVLGAKAQNLVLAEFSDFQCPFCAKAHATVNQFMAKHGDEVTLTFKHFPLSDIHPQAMAAAQAAWAAGQQNQFWQYHDRLFENQKQISPQFLVEVAEQLGLDLSKFNQDRNSAKASQAIAADMELGKSLGLSGTPFFVFNGLTFSGALDLAQLESVLAQVKNK
ncbi:MAG: DsbA family protein [Pseudanabaenaceae cyanobacterium bins.68]|nr:DsbA family protein [Pseudanabaenaceae cyanobacterium bins.68]